MIHVRLKPKKKRKNGFDFAERLILAEAALRTVEITTADSVLCVSSSAGALESKVLRAVGCHVHSIGKICRKYSDVFKDAGRIKYLSKVFEPATLGEYDFIILFDTGGALAEAGLLSSVQGRLTKGGTLLIADGTAGYASGYYVKILTDLNVENVYDGRLTVITASRTERAEAW
ncbi:MAG: hypothetical protein LBT55_03305 [Clostridiaceae bacterium]|jgi:hypothetical protein|nr:hypothetical protein [Clostridiaceae bacterium]